MTQGGRLLLQLTNMGTGESLTIHFRNTPQEMYLTDVVPGEYEFTQLLYAPVPTTEGNIRRDNLRVPPEMSFMGQPFSVEAGKAYYVGEWFGAVDRDVDFYVVVSRIRTKWGLYQLRYDYEEATTAMKRLYPTLDLIEARPAWRR